MAPCAGAAGAAFEVEVAGQLGARVLAPRLAVCDDERREVKHHVTAER